MTYISDCDWTVAKLFENAEQITIYQPVATLHMQNGLLGAVRVVRLVLDVKMAWSDIPSDNNITFEYATMNANKRILRLVKSEVIEVSMTDLREYKMLRNRLLGDANQEVMITGALRLPGISFDGRVLRPEIYQMITSWKMKNGRMVVDPDASFFLNYEGTVLTKAEVVQRTPGIATILNEMQTLYSLTPRQCLIDDYGIGNFSRKDMLKARIDLDAFVVPEPDVIAALQLTARADLSPSYMVHGLRLWVIPYEYTGAQPAHCLLVPRGYGAFNMSGPSRGLMQLNFPRGMYDADITTDRLPHIYAEEPLYYFSATAKSQITPLTLPCVTGRPGSRHMSSFQLNLQNAKYENRKIDMLDALKDVGSLRISLLGEQMCDALTLPCADVTHLALAVSKPQFTLTLEPVRLKYLTGYRGKHTLDCVLSLANAVTQTAMVNLTKANYSSMHLTFGLKGDAEKEGSGRAGDHRVLLTLPSRPKAGAGIVIQSMQGIDECVTCTADVPAILYIWRNSSTALSVDVPSRTDFCCNINTVTISLAAGTSWRRRDFYFHAGIENIVILTHDCVTGDKQLKQYIKRLQAQIGIHIKRGTNVNTCVRIDTIYDEQADEMRRCNNELTQAVQHCILEDIQ